MEKMDTDRKAVVFGSPLVFSAGKDAPVAIRSSQHPKTLALNTFNMPNSEVTTECFPIASLTFPLQGTLLFDPSKPGTRTGLHERSRGHRVSPDPAVVRVRGRGPSPGGAKERDQVEENASAGYTLLTRRIRIVVDTTIRSCTNCGGYFRAV